MIKKTNATGKTNTVTKGKTTSKNNTAAKPKETALPVQRNKLIDMPLSVTQPKSPVKVLFAASECQPFIATGGLGDVIGSLPQAIAKTGADVRVILPLYLDIGKDYKDKMKFLFAEEIELSWRKQYCGVFSYVKNNITYYFVDNDFYFKKHGLYGHFDDGERFAFFCKCVLDLLKSLEFSPDIIHCNDWHTALIPVYLKSIYSQNQAFEKIKTVFTIHNIEYQGKFSPDILEDVFGIPKHFYSLVEYEDIVNLVKGAIQCCDIVSTVSPTYAKEILYPYYSHGLHYILKENEYKLRGIMNGIDYSVYNSMTDKALFRNYSIETLQNKVFNKTGLQKLLNLPVDENIPLIAVVSRLVSHKGIDLIKNKAEEILKEKVQFVLLGKGDSFYENSFLDIEKIYSEKMRIIIEYNPDLARKIYAAADILLMPSKSEPCGLAQMIASRYGTVPIIRETGGLADSVKDIGTDGGNGFTFANFNADDMCNRIENALKMYKNKSEWTALMKKVMSTDFTWNKSANGYMEIYTELI